MSQTIVDSDLDVEEELTNDKNHFHSVHIVCHESFPVAKGTLIEGNCGALYRTQGLVSTRNTNACKLCVNVLSNGNATCFICKCSIFQPFSH